MIQGLIQKVKERLHQHPLLAGLPAPPEIVIEAPPSVKMGELALPLAFALAKTLKRPPRAIAQELQKGLAEIPGVRRVEAAGAGYLDVYVDRTEWLGLFWR